MDSHRLATVYLGNPMKLRTPLVLGATAVAVVVGSALPANAADTTSTFTLAGGSISLSAPASAALDNGVTGAASVTGSLGPVVVTDERGGTTDWGMTAASTAFTTTPAGSSSSDVSYDSGAAVTSGTVTPTSTGATSIDTVAAPVAAGTLVSGNNTATYDPTLTVTMPTSALVGEYSGVVTTSVA